MISALQYFNSVQPTNSQALVILELLKNPNCRLEDLLDEDALLQEFKEGKPTLMAFFDSAKLDRLLDYVLLDCDNPEERKAAYKFPSVAAELLSAPVSRVLDHFAQRSEERMPHFDRLLSGLHDAQRGQPVVEDNLTRIGYVQKILMGLIGARPAVFMLQLLNDRSLHASLLANCQSKSLHGLLLLLLLGQSSLQATVADTPHAKEAEALRAATLPARLQLLETALATCLKPPDSPAGHDAHLNVCGLLSTLFLRDFPDRPAFLDLFAARFFTPFTEELLRSFGDAASRAYGVLFTFLEVASKEPDLALLPTPQTAELLQTLLRLVAEVVAGETVQEDSTPASRRTSVSRATSHSERSAPALMPEAVQTTSYGKELQKTNAKLIRMLDVLRLVFKKHATAKPDLPWLRDAPFAHALVRLLSLCPQNNILHNQILKFWLMLIELNDRDLFDCFLAANADLHRLVTDCEQRRAANLSNAKNPARNGYFGHLKALFDAMLKSPFKDCLEQRGEFAQFCAGFYAQERVFETFCLGDVDIGQVDAEAETFFAFSVDDFKRKYAKFLDFEEEFTADSGPESPEEPARLAADHGDLDAPALPRLPSHELEEEVKNLDVMTVEEETAFFDSNYWKPVIDYDIEKLTLEMGFQAL